MIHKKYPVRIDFSVFIATNGVDICVMHTSHNLQNKIDRLIYCRNWSNLLSNILDKILLYTIF